MLAERYLKPETSKIPENQAKLAEQASGTSIPSQKTVPIFLYPGDSEANDDNTFARWAHSARRLPSMNAFRASASKADVCLKRKMRYQFAN